MKFQVVDHLVMKRWTLYHIVRIKNSCVIGKCEILVQAMILRVWTALSLSKPPLKKQLNPQVHLLLWVNNYYAFSFFGMYSDMHTYIQMIFCSTVPFISYVVTTLIRMLSADTSELTTLLTQGSCITSTTMLWKTESISVRRIHFMQTAGPSASGTISTPLCGWWFRVEEKHL